MMLKTPPLTGFLPSDTHMAFSECVQSHVVQKQQLDT